MTDVVTGDVDAFHVVTASSEYIDGVFAAEFAASLLSGLCKVSYSQLILIQWLPLRMMTSALATGCLQVSI